MSGEEGGGASAGSGSGGRPVTKWPELDETRSVKVGLDREELMAEFALLAEEERAEMERAQSVFTEAVHHLQHYSQLDLDTIANLLTALEDSGRDEGGAWEYFFREGMHQVLLVLLNAEEVVSDAGRSDQILRLWERILRFVFKLSPADQQVVYEELRRQGMVETLAFTMRHQPDHHPILRRAAFLLHHLHINDTAPHEQESEDPTTTVRMRNAEGLLDRFRAIEAQPAHFSPDLIAQVRNMREAADGTADKRKKKQAEEEENKQRKLEKEAKRTEESERSRKQEADKYHQHHQSSPQESQHRVRVDEVVDLTSPPSERAPLLPTHTRHAVHQVVSGDGCCNACVLM